MKKAQIEVQDKIKLVDVIVELLDARIPLSSRNQVLYKLTKDKTRLVVLTKKDLADAALTEKWVEYFKAQGFQATFADLNDEKDVKAIVRKVEELGSIKNAKYAAKGMKPQPVRAMIIGIPNVGKSTLINKISGRKAASVENKPGHTKAQQWIKVSNQFELLDTPGILPPSYESGEHAINLAFVGSINQEILPNDELAVLAFLYVLQNYKELLLKRFPYLNFSKNVIENFKEIARRRGFLNKSGEEDLEKTYKMVADKSLSLAQVSALAGVSLAAVLACIIVPFTPPSVVAGGAAVSTLFIGAALVGGTYLGMKQYNKEEVRVLTTAIFLQSLYFAFTNIINVTSTNNCNHYLFTNFLYASFLDIPARAASSAAADLVDPDTISFTISLISPSDIFLSGAGATTITISPRGASISIKSAG